MTLRITPGDLDDPGVRALVTAHFAHAADNTTPDNIYALDIDGLRAPDVSFYAAQDTAGLAGIGALRHLPPSEGEVKSIHVAQDRRGRGVGREILRFLIDRACAEGLSRLWLETGSAPGYAASRALYTADGFEECPAFGDYPDHPGSCFMTKAL